MEVSAVGLADPLPEEPAERRAGHVDQRGDLRLRDRFGRVVVDKPAGLVDARGCFVFVGVVGRAGQGLRASAVCQCVEQADQAEYSRDPLCLEEFG